MTRDDSRWTAIVNMFLCCITGHRIYTETSPAEFPESEDTGKKSLKGESIEQYLGLAAQQFRDMLHLGPAEDRFLGLQQCHFAADGDWSAPQAAGADGSGGKKCFGGVFVVSPGADVISLWELDLLMRERFSQLISETDQSIRSLLQLVRVTVPV
jgi:hypothetical protein